MTLLLAVNITALINGTLRFPPSKITTPFVISITRVVLLVGGV